MFDALLSLLFPPSHNEKVLADIHALFPDQAATQHDSTTFITSCARYDTPEVKASVLVNKKTGSERAAVLLANLLSDVLMEQLSDEFLWNNQRVFVVPIPLSKKQLRARGFNQMSRVLELSPQEIRRHAVYDLLQKTRETLPQKTLARESRLTNLHRSFAVSSKYKLHNAHVVIVDDVTTTGATLLEAARALTAAGAHKVTLIALTRA